MRYKTVLYFVQASGRANSQWLSPVMVSCTLHCGSSLQTIWRDSCHRLPRWSPSWATLWAVHCERAPFHICNAPSKRLFLQKLFLSWLGRGREDRTRYLFLLSFRWSPCVGNGSQNRQRNVQASKSALNILTSRWKTYIAFSSTVTKEGFPRLWHWNRTST